MYRESTHGDTLGMAGGDLWPLRAPLIQNIGVCRFTELLPLCLHLLGECHEAVIYLLIHYPFFPLGPLTERACDMKLLVQAQLRQHNIKNQGKRKVY